MRDYFFNKKDNEIFIYDDLCSYQLNDTGVLVFENYIKGLSVSEIVKALLDEYEVSTDEAQCDVEHLIHEFQKLGIEAQHLNDDSEDDDDFNKVAKELHLHTPIIHVIQNCNSPCKMCDCWQTKEKTWHSAAKLRPFFEIMKMKGAQALMISGGEPLLHPEIKQIISDVKEIGLGVMLNTNALLLHRHLWLADYNIEQLVVSMDGIDAETYKMYRGINGFDIVWKNLKSFQKNSPSTRIGIRTILNKFNYNKMDAFFDLLEANGMHSVGLSPADIDSESFSRDKLSLKRIDDLKKLLLPTLNEIENFLDEFTPESEYYRKIDEAWKKELSSWKPYDFIQCMLFYLGIQNDEKKIFSNRPCYFPFTSLVLDYNGDVKNCFYSDAFGHLDQIEEIDWTFSTSMPLLRDSKKCEGCRGKVFCGLEIPKVSSNLG